MSDNTKFTEEEMKKISELQQTYSNVQNALGQLGVNKIRIEQQFQELATAEKRLQTKFVETQKEETEFVDSINNKYGRGSLDLTTGVFTSNPEETDKKTDKKS